MPDSRRPETSAATPWAPSWAIVTTCRVERHSAGERTSSAATAAVPSRTGGGRSGTVAVTRAQNRPRISTVGSSVGLRSGRSSASRGGPAVNRTDLAATRGRRPCRAPGCGTPHTAGGAARAGSRNPRGMSSSVPVAPDGLVPDGGAEADLPVTVSFTRRADPGHAREMAAWVRAGLSMAESFPGFLGGGWVRAAGRRGRVAHALPLRRPDRAGRVGGLPGASVVAALGAGARGGDPHRAADRHRGLVRRAGGRGGRHAVRARAAPRRAGSRRRRSGWSSSRSAC